MGFFEKILDFVLIRKKYWLFPIIILLFLLFGILILDQGFTIGPFIYAIF